MIDGGVPREVSGPGVWGVLADGLELYLEAGFHAAMSQPRRIRRRADPRPIDLAIDRGFAECGMEGKSSSWRWSSPDGMGKVSSNYHRLDLIKPELASTLKPFRKESNTHPPQAMRSDVNHFCLLSVARGADTVCRGRGPTVCV